MPEPVIPQPGTTPAPATPPSSAPSSTPVVPPTSAPPATTPPPAPQAPAAAPSQGETVPRDVHDNIVRALREARRKLRLGGTAPSQPGGPSTPPAAPGTPGTYDPKYVQELESGYKTLSSRVALFELKDEVRHLLKDYPDLPKEYRQLILRNPTAFVKPSSTGAPVSIDDALLDIEEYVQENFKMNPVTAAPTAPPKTEIQVAGSNSNPSGASATTPVEIQKILAKPVDEWTETDQKKLSEYKASHTQ